MKFIFKLIVLVALTKPILSESLEVKYLVKTRGLTIGDLVWKINISPNEYQTRLELKNNKFLSKIYSFSGLYEAEGLKKDNVLKSAKYFQKWRTKKKQRDILIFFENNKIKKLTITPKEKEMARIKYLDLINYNDPLTSFINILLNNKQSLTVDGRRAYLLSAKKIENHKKISINNYKNIWADHKRNDLKYIEFFISQKNFLPKKINIKYKGMIFSLIKI